MEISALYTLASQQNIPVIPFPLEKTGSMSIMGSDGSCCIGLDDRVRDGSTLERVHLSHELGHCVTGSFSNIHAAVDHRRRHENRADQWAIRQLIPGDALSSGTWPTASASRKTSSKKPSATTSTATWPRSCTSNGQWSLTIRPLHWQATPNPWAPRPALRFKLLFGGEPRRVIRTQCVSRRYFPELNYGMISTGDYFHFDSLRGAQRPVSFLRSNCCLNVSRLPYQP